MGRVVWIVTPHAMAAQQGYAMLALHSEPPNPQTELCACAIVALEVLANSILHVFPAIRIVLHVKLAVLRTVAKAAP